MPENNTPNHESGIAPAYLTVITALMTAIAAALLLGLFLFQAVMVPRWIAIFQDFDTELPTLTVTLLTTPAALFFAAYGLGIAGLIAKDFIPSLGPGVKIILNLIAVLIALLMILLYAIAIYLPMVRLMDSMM